MKTCKRSLIAVVMSLYALLLLSGCGNDKKFTPAPRVERTRLLQLSVLQTEADGRTAVRAFVQPAAEMDDELYRFELYHYLPRSANPRGKRLRLWPEVAPGKAIAENPLWKPHLRAFEIGLLLDNAPSKTAYLLEMTVLKGNAIQYSEWLKIASKAAPKP